MDKTKHLYAILIVWYRTFAINKIKKLVYRTWIGKSFEAMKLSSTTEKGDLAENFCAELIKSLGYSDAETKQPIKKEFLE